MYLTLLTLATNECIYKENIIDGNCDFQIHCFNRNQNNNDFALGYIIINYGSNSKRRSYCG
jgi:hypothetical protein